MCENGEERRLGERTKAQISRFETRVSGFVNERRAAAASRRTILVRPRRDEERIGKESDSRGAALRVDANCFLKRGSACAVFENE